ncbi:leucine-rich colipase-like protein 1 [Budorcas taxicolor]|uniref:leucine-rich colipase-like protein 1 n=1 Tax=Budorcas taxicolor TaxID=37181 RepID=UPI0022833B21|nr:leucine-rich colipase-like protein 1 [Budorcas taxicolor]
MAGNRQPPRQAAGDPESERGAPGALRAMASAGRLLLLLLCLLPVAPVLTIKKYQHLSHKRIGEPCETHSECQSDCCVTNSLNPQKFCTAQTVFQQCLSWKKPNGYICKDHLECQSKCCVVNNYGVQTYCKAKTIFLQCLPWRKPNWDYCDYHSECRSKCCIRLNELSPNRCVPQSGILLQCLPWQPLSAPRQRKGSEERGCSGAGTTQGRQRALWAASRPGSQGAGRKRRRPGSSASRKAWSSPGRRFSANMENVVSGA